MWLTTLATPIDPQNGHFISFNTITSLRHNFTTKGRIQQESEVSMSNITLINSNGQFTLDSREVAEMIDKDHAHLMRDIRSYVEILDNSTNPKMDSFNFFIESSYVDRKNETRGCYLLTRKGCDMVANKMTGEKGVLFTATYVTKFEEMEKSQPLNIISGASPQLQLMNQMLQAMAKAEFEARETKAIALEAKSGLDQARETINGIKDTMAELPKDQWREWVNRSISEIVKAKGFKYDELRNESYKLLEERAAANLSRRVSEAVKRLQDRGATKTMINNYCKLDAIEEDKRLKEIYSGIVRELRIRYLV
jgi:Rha family phage regulatory protein